MGMTYLDSNAYTLLGNAASTLDDAKAAYIAAQSRVNNEIIARDAAKADLDAAYATYIPSIQNFDSLLSTPPDGYIATPPSPHNRLLAPNNPQEAPKVTDPRTESLTLTDPSNPQA